MRFTLSIIRATNLESRKFVLSIHNSRKAEMNAFAGYVDNQNNLVNVCYGVGPS